MLAVLQTIEHLHIFTSVLNIKGRPFGQLNKPKFGMSDSNMGTQWNLAFTAESEEAHLGVNLKGSNMTTGPLPSSCCPSRTIPALRISSHRSTIPMGFSLGL
ncbi:MAG: hypothetical protein F4206_02090 [Gammaproteobacteria bacterium]|nr:hypothetical protein [Gammaproteobacteria bacterium]MYG65507.1 hypothetical protein [Gammaproteobacteria bacterium]